MGKFLYVLYDVFFPRFITEEVAFKHVGDGVYEPFCTASHVPAGYEFDAIGTMRSFNFFGLAICGKLVGELRDWPTRA